MPIYSYSALDKRGSKKIGAIYANDNAEAYQKLSDKKLFVTSIQRCYFLSKSIKTEDILLFFTHVNFQLTCGMRINDAIDSFVDSGRNKFLNTSLSGVSENLKKGNSLSQSFEKSAIFDKTIIGLLEAAENTGRISETIASILDFLKLRIKWKRKVKKAISYPIFIVLISLFVMLFCSIILGPQILSLVQNYEKGEIPMLTKFALFALPELTKFLCAICLIIGAIIFYCCISQKQYTDLMLKIPKVGEIFKKMELWQLFRILHIALVSKLDFIQALSLGIDASAANSIKGQLKKIYNDVMCGYKIADSFANFLPVQITTAIAIGENGNNLEECFLQISRNQYEELLDTINALGKSLSTGLILFAGSIFIFILYSLFQPIYNYVEIAGM